MAEREKTAPAADEKVAETAAGGAQGPAEGTQPDLAAVLARMDALEARNAELEAALAAKPSGADPVAEASGHQLAHKASPTQARDQLAGAILNWLQANGKAPKPVYELAATFKVKAEEILEAADAVFFLTVSDERETGVVGLNG